MNDRRPDSRGGEPGDGRRPDALEHSDPWLRGRVEFYPAGSYEPLTRRLADVDSQPAWRRTSRAGLYSQFFGASHSKAAASL